MESLAAKMVAGSIVLIGVYLVVTNPNGTSQATNSIAGAGTSWIKALQGR